MKYWFSIDYNKIYINLYSNIRCHAVFGLIKYLLCSNRLYFWSRNTRRDGIYSDTDWAKGWAELILYSPKNILRKFTLMSGRIKCSIYYIFFKKSSWTWPSLGRILRRPCILKEISWTIDLVTFASSTSCKTGIYSFIH